MQMKSCSKCKKEMPATLEYFKKCNKTNSGLASQCKECANLYNREYRKNSPVYKERIKEYAEREKLIRKEKREQLQELLDKTEKTKICTKCGKEFPATIEYFDKAKRGKYGLSSNCKNCVSDYNKQRYKEKKELILEQNRNYNKKNREKIAQRRKAYRINNKEREEEYRKKYYKEHKKEILKKAKIYRETHKEHYKKLAVQYRKDHLEERKEYNKNFKIMNKGLYIGYKQKRRALIKSLPATLTSEQWEQIKADFNYSCAYCGMTEEEHFREYNEPIHQEHFIAVTNEGEYTHNNIIPACKSCNSSKSNKDFFEWYPEKEFYSKKREERILKYLNYTKDGNQQLTIAI